jgi:hypothetical protein
MECCGRLEMPISLQETKMKKKSGFMRLVVLVAVALALLLGTSGSRAQNQRNFWMLNNTTKTISQFLVSTHDDESWGRNILGTATIAHGMGTLVYFPPDSKGSCLMDFRLIYNDGSEQTYRQGRNVCLLGAVQFNAKDSIGLSLPTD